MLLIPIPLSAFRPISAGVHPLEDICFHHHRVVYDAEGELSKTLGPSALRELALHTTDRTNTQQRCNGQSMDPVPRECSAFSTFRGEEGQGNGVVAFETVTYY